jgi:hypothetical protein
MWGRVPLVRSDVSEERMASIIRVERINELGITLPVTSVVPSSPILFTLMMAVIRTSETSILTRAAERHIQKTAFFIVTAVKVSNLTLRGRGLKRKSTVCN